MTKRTGEQAFNDGRLAFAQGHGLESNPRRSRDARAKWQEGWEHERSLRAQRAATAEQIAEGRAVAQRLNEWVRTL